MENRFRLNIPICAVVADDSNSVPDPSKRTFLRAAGLLMAGLVVPQARGEKSPQAMAGSGRKVVVAIIGGVRRAETFSPGRAGEHPSPLARPAPQGAVLHRMRATKA